MALEAYLTLKWLHVLSATVVIGGIATLPMVRAFARRERLSDDATARILEAVGTRLVVPAAVLLLLTGLLMASGFGWVGSLYTLGGARWTLVGLALWLLVTLTMSLLVGATERRLARGDAAPALWTRWRVGLAVAGVLLLAAEGVMVFKPTL
jgi:uncharacterized membrane protein